MESTIYVVTVTKEILTHSYRKRVWGSTGPHVLCLKQFQSLDLLVQFAHLMGCSVLPDGFVTQMLKKCLKMGRILHQCKIQLTRKIYSNLWSSPLSNISCECFKAWVSWKYGFIRKEKRTWCSIFWSGNCWRICEIMTTKPASRRDILLICNIVT